ncbi:golgin subfamily A member 2-like isoform X1 [Lethenteron reissneri]|uniref:golgin subfamily A member 2-like isoform X1 n=1 Tax=Lethenteron reissneri TaxID=7753 RepID=UPI002AB6E043|nr:golgin subfamily A member 2-like isoform X1 [Lethenteron reissneri]
MAEGGSRQARLAAAKKKLKEYQQKAVPGGGDGGSAKKKRRGRDGEEGGNDPRDERDSREQSEDERLSASAGEADEETAAGAVGGSPPPTLTEVAEVMDGGEEEQQEGMRDVSSTERLRQISVQINGLMSQSNYRNGESGSHSADTRELETRNQELTQALDAASLDHKRLLADLHDAKQQNDALETELLKVRADQEKRLHSEGSALEQLQVHVQTIGILVSEKSELQNTLSLADKSLQQRAGEVEDLSARLNAGRQRVSELERALSTVSSQHKQAEKLAKELQTERAAVAEEREQLTRVRDELTQQTSEQAEQLASRAAEVLGLREFTEELKGKLHMADIMVQQLSSQAGMPHLNQQLQQLSEEREQLQQQLHAMSESVQQLMLERQQHLQQMEEQGRLWQETARHSAQQVELLSREKDEQVVRITEMERSLHELEQQKVVLCEQAAQKSSAAVATSEQEGPSEREHGLAVELERARREKDELVAQYHAQVRDNEHLSELNREAESRLLALESRLGDLGCEASDRQRLLETAQADKATISRALAQNRQLKEQLAEMQNGFVKLSNENMELGSALQSEQHVKKELARHMGSLQENSHEVKEQLQAKCAEAEALVAERSAVLQQLQQYGAAVVQLQAERDELHRQCLAQSTLLDRVQHQEAEARSALHIAHDKLRALAQGSQVTVDGSQVTAAEGVLQGGERRVGVGGPEEGWAVGGGLQGVLEDMASLLEAPTDAPAPSPTDSPADEAGAEEPEETVSHLRALVEQRESERAQLISRLGDVYAALRRLGNLAAPPSAAPHHGEGAVSPQEHESLRAAMEQLQVRFQAVMREKADLRDQLEQLEHRCEQLSGETDTIGEYIALYQSQRDVMRQRHRDKDEFINRLALDRDNMKVKLGELQELVMRLLAERNAWGLEGPAPRGVAAVTAAAAGGPNEEKQEEGMGPHLPNGTQDGDEGGEGGEGGESEGASARERAAETGTERAHTDDDPRPPTTAEPPGTAGQIMQLLQELQESRGPSSSSYLDESTCIPFFYRVDTDNEVKVMLI